MKNPLICSILFTALMASPAAAHTAGVLMLKDAAIDHDLVQVRVEHLKPEGPVAAEDRFRAGGKVFTSDAHEAKPVTSH
jgi:hypothetical protein